jgi:outer membrane biosynthesis protein TonB
MKCSDVDRILPDIVDGVPIEGGQHIDVQSHLKTCADCSELVSDLKMIASEARHLSDSESEDPPARVWARIAAELRAEGLIREPELARPVLVPARQRRWNPFWLAPVAVAILAAGSYMLIHRPPQTAASGVAQQAPSQQTEPQVAQQTPSQPPAAQQPTQQARVQSSKPASTQASPRRLAAPEVAKNAATPDIQPSGPTADVDSAEQAQLSQPSSSEDNQFLSEVSQRAPTMRATYANQLQAVNSEIRETRAYLSRYPSDMDARQHLLDVYQQKAMLYQIALDRIQ